MCIPVDTLREPFPESAIQSRKGTFGKRVDYIDIQQVLKRLDEAFGGEWSFRVIKDHEHEYTRKPGTDKEMKVLEVRVLGELLRTEDGETITKQQYGSNETDNPDHMPITDSYKAAASDCLKKCANLFGVAAEVYGFEEAEPDAPVEEMATPAQVQRIQKELSTRTYGAQHQATVDNLEKAISTKTLNREDAVKWVEYFEKNPAA